MGGGFTKEIKIRAHNLKGPPGVKEIYIVLGFDQDAIKTHKASCASDVAVWKVAPFSIGRPGNQCIDVIYNAKLGVCKAQEDSDKVIEAAVNTPIDVGYQIDLVNENDPQFENLATYSNPQGFAVNDKVTDEPVTIGFGLYDSDLTFNPVAVWQGVRNGASVDVQFTPIISIFATSKLEVGQVFKGHVDSLLWNHNLADVKLPEILSFNLVWDEVKKEFVLTMT